MGIIRFDRTEYYVSDVKFERIGGDGAFRCSAWIETGKVGRLTDDENIDHGEVKVIGVNDSDKIYSFRGEGLNE